VHETAERLAMVRLADTATTGLLVELSVITYGDDGDV
jgi:hypothetical protein